MKSEPRAQTPRVDEFQNVVEMRSYPDLLDLARQLETELSQARAGAIDADALIKRMLTMIGHAVGAHLVKEDENNPVKQWIADANALLSSRPGADE